MALCNSHEGRPSRNGMIARGGPPVWNHTKWGKFKMALESKGKEGGKEGEEFGYDRNGKLLSARGGREGGGICRIETFARHRPTIWVEWKPPIEMGREGGREADWLVNHIIIIKSPLSFSQSDCLWLCSPLIPLPLLLLLPSETRRSPTAGGIILLPKWRDDDDLQRRRREEGSC